MLAQHGDFTKVILDQRTHTARCQVPISKYKRSILLFEDWHFFNGGKQRIFSLVPKNSRQAGMKTRERDQTYKRSSLAPLTQTNKLQRLKGWQGSCPLPPAPALTQALCQAHSTLHGRWGLPCESSASSVEFMKQRIQVSQGRCEKDGKGNITCLNGSSNVLSCCWFVTSLEHEQCAEITHLRRSTGRLTPQSVLHRQSNKLSLVPLCCSASVTLQQSQTCPGDVRSPL